MNSSRLPYILFLSNVLLLGMTSFFPFFRAFDYINHVWLLLSVVWFFLAYLYSPEFYTKINIFSLIFLIYICSAISLSYLGGGSGIGNRYLEFFQVIIFIWSANIIICKEGDKQYKNIVLTILLVLLFVSLFTLIAYVGQPKASRMAKSGSEWLAKGVGGYEYIYMLVFIFISFMYACFSKIAIMFRLLLFPVTALVLLNIAKSNFSTALIMTTISISTWALFRNLSRSYFVVCILAAIVAMPILLTVIVYVAKFYAETFEGSINADRALEIIKFITTGVMDSSMAARFKTFTLSIDTFTSYPLFGSVLGSDPEAILSSTGRHSYVLDGFALFGALFGIINIMVLLYPLYVVTLRDKKIPTAYSFSVLALFLVFISVNNFTPSIGFALFFVMPLVMEVYKYSYVKKYS